MLAVGLALHSSCRGCPQNILLHLECCISLFALRLGKAYILVTFFGRQSRSTHEFIDLAFLWCVSHFINRLTSYGVLSEHFKLLILLLADSSDAVATPIAILSEDPCLIDIEASHLLLFLQHLLIVTAHYT